MSKAHVLMSGDISHVAQPWERSLSILPKLAFSIIIGAWQPIVNREPDTWVVTNNIKYYKS